MHNGAISLNANYIPVPLSALTLFFLGGGGDRKGIQPVESWVLVCWG